MKLEPSPTSPEPAALPTSQAPAPEGRKNSKNKPRPSTANGSHATLTDRVFEQIRYLAKRKNKSLAVVLPASKARPSALQWGLPTGDQWQSLHEQLHQLMRFARKGAGENTVEDIQRWTTQWLDQHSVVQWSDELPVVSLLLQAIGLTHAAPRLARILPAAETHRLLYSLIGMARDAESLRIDTAPWCYFLAAELGYSLALLLPEAADIVGTAEPYRKSISQSLCEMTDGEGLLHARYLPIYSGLLASWTRCSALADHHGYRFPLPEGRQQLRLLVGLSIRLLRPGTPGFALGPVDDSAASMAAHQDLWAAALQYAGGRKARRLADTVQHPAGKGTRIKNSVRRAQQRIAPTLVGEWSELAVLRGGWQPQAPQLAVSFTGGMLRSELHASGQLVWSGDCQPLVTVNQQPLQTQGDVEAVCQFHDEDSDYLELQIEYAGGWKLQRQMYLARRDEFLIIADAIVGTASSQIDYAVQYPLAATQLTLEAETTEAWLTKHQRRLALVLPLAMPEWRSAVRAGGLTAEGHNLSLRQSTMGSALFCPLFFDFSQRRMQKPYTWRQLTVAADRRIEPADAAVGYRVQIGKTQWLMYRSLGRRTGRTLLGQHVIHEFVLGRFNKHGLLDELVMVE